MTQTLDTTIRPASAADAPDLAKLIDIAGEGIPTWLWAQSAEGGQTPLDVGQMRARRDAGGFSYTNARLAARGGEVLGMMLGYPIHEAPTDDPDTLPAPIAPFVELEAKSAGTWYVNALAVYPAFQGAGVGAQLLAAAERQAREAGLSRMSIQVYGQNSGAVRLYERMGYARTAHAPVRLHPCQPYYTGDVLLLVKQV